MQTAKPYKAISVKDMDSEELKTLAKTIAQVLGFTGVPKKTKKSVVEAEVAVDEVAELA